MEVEQGNIFSHSAPDTHTLNMVEYCIDAVRHWFMANTFSPIWMYKHLRQPLIGYVVGACLQGIMVLTITELIKISPFFRFPGLLAMLFVGLIVLNWGPAPSLITLLLGTILVFFFVLPPFAPHTQDSGIEILTLLLFLVVGLGYVIVSSKLERARRQTERLRARLEAVIEAVPDAIGIYDAYGVSILLNKVARQLAYAQRNRSIPAELPTFYNLRTLAGDTLVLEQLPLVRALRGETVSNIEAHYLDAEGIDRNIYMSAAPFYNAKGVLEGAVGITHDITALRQAERETQRRMQEFLSMASHELRTPITTIKASTQLTRRWVGEFLAGQDSREKLEAIHKLLERSERQVGTLNRLVGDLLDVSRIESSKLQMRPAISDLTTSVREVVYEQQQVAMQRVVHLNIPPTCEKTPVLVDAERIEQVLTNYITNALKYSASYCPVEVSMQKEDTLVRVLVRDEGPGLLPEEQQRIWERFYQVERVNVKSGSSVGLGLGLPISRAIIEQHQGQVGVESKLGSGSTFWFTLPLLEE